MAQGLVVFRSRLVVKDKPGNVLAHAQTFFAAVEVRIQKPEYFFISYFSHVEAIA